MTAFLIALVGLVGAIAMLDLLLTVGVIRRLRQHTDKLATLQNLGGAPVQIVIGAGEQVGEFAATTTDGEPVSRDLLLEHTLVGVLSPDCSACQEQLPTFVERAKNFPGGRGQVLAVLAGEPAQVEQYRQQVAPVARVVIEPPIEGAVAAALHVQGWPAFAVIDAAGTVLASGVDLDQLTPGSPVAA